MTTSTRTYQRPTLYPKQENAIFCDERYSVIEGSTKCGKTVACLAWILEQALMGKPGQTYWWIAPVYPQAKIAFRRLKRGLQQEVFRAIRTRRNSYGNGSWKTSQGSYRSS